MSRYHVNPETQRPNLCRAETPQGCKYYVEGQPEPPHFDTKEEARAYVEKSSKEENKTFSSMSKDEVNHPIKPAQRGEAEADSMKPNIVETPERPKLVEENYAEKIASRINEIQSKLQEADEKYLERNYDKREQELKQKLAKLKANYSNVGKIASREIEISKNERDEAVAKAEKALMNTLIEHKTPFGYARYYAKKQLTVLGYKDTYSDKTRSGKEYTIKSGELQEITAENLVSSSKTYDNIKEGTKAFVAKHQDLMLNAYTYADRYNKAKENPIDVSDIYDEGQEEIKQAEQELAEHEAERDNMLRYNAQVDARIPTAKILPQTSTVNKEDLRYENGRINNLFAVITVNERTYGFRGGVIGTRKNVRLDRIDGVDRGANGEDRFYQIYGGEKHYIGKIDPNHVKNTYSFVHTGGTVNGFVTLKDEDKLY